MNKGYLKMDNIEIRVTKNGEPILLSDISDETIANIKKTEQNKNVPTARTALYYLDNKNSSPRLILKVFSQLKEDLISVLNQDYSILIIDLENGILGNYFQNEKEFQETCIYSNIKPLEID